MADATDIGPPPPASLADKLRFAVWGIRYFDVLVLMAYPTMGAVFASKDYAESSIVLDCGTPLLRFVLFTVLNFLFVTHVFIYNDWSDARLNPEEPKRRSRHALKHPVLTSRQVLICSFVLAVIAFLGFAFLSWRLLVVGAFIEMITLAYSHPVVNLKGRPIISTAIHFFGATFYFMGGWAVFQPFSMKDVMLGIFFGLVLAAGHFSNEIEDFEQDMAAGIRTNAIAYGQRTVFRAGLILFLLSSIFFLGIAYFQFGNDEVFSWVAGLLILVWIIQTVRYLKWKAGDPVRNFRRFYRITYALFCLILIFLCITQSGVETQLWAN